MPPLNRTLNMCKQPSSTTGTGTYTVGPAVAPFRAFIDIITVGTRFYARVGDAVNFECGIYTLASSTTVSRTSIKDNTSGLAAPWSWGVGTREIVANIIGDTAVMADNNGSDFVSPLTTLQNLGAFPIGISGGTDGKVVRISGSNTCVDAANTDTLDQLGGIMLKVGGVYFPPGRVVYGLSGLTAGTMYYLGTAGALTSTRPTMSSSVAIQPLGIALTTSALSFVFYPPLRNA